MINRVILTVLIVLLAGLMIPGMKGCFLLRLIMDIGVVDVRITLSEYGIESSIRIFSVDVPYRFIVNNIGKLNHEFMILPRGEEDKSEALLMVEEEDLKPGGTVTREYTFFSAGNFEFACHIDDHYEKGMILPITVQ